MRTSPLRVKIIVFSVRSIMQPTTSPDCQGRPNGSLPKCQRWPCGEARERFGVGETRREVETCGSEERHVKIHVQGIRARACGTDERSPPQCPSPFLTFHGPWNVRDSLSCFPFPRISAVSSLLPGLSVVSVAGLGLCRPPKWQWGGGVSSEQRDG